MLLLCYILVGFEHVSRRLYERHCVGSGPVAWLGLGWFWGGFGVVLGWFWEAEFGRRHMGAHQIHPLGDIIIIQGGRWV